MATLCRPESVVTYAEGIPRLISNKPSFMRQLHSHHLIVLCTCLGESENRPTNFAPGKPVGRADFEDDQVARDLKDAVYLEVDVRPSDDPGATELAYGIVDGGHVGVLVASDFEVHLHT